MSVDPRIEELLVRVAAGELEPDAPELESLLAADAGAREAAEEWLATAAALEALGRGEAAERARAGAPSPADLALARDFVRARSARPRARPARLWLGALAAAAVVLAVWLLWPEPRADAPLVLGQGGIELLEPDPGWRAFRWRPSVSLPSLARYRVVIEGGGRELLRIEGLDRPAFEPDPAQLALLADLEALHWSVVLVGADGSESVLAWGAADSSRR